MKIQGFFPTGVLFHQVPSQLSNQIESLIIPKLNYLERKDETYTDYYKKRIIEINEIKGLVTEIEKCVMFYANEIKVEPKPISNYWVQNYSTGDIHSRHNHGRSLFSIVYWVRANNNAGNLVIYDPSPYRGVWGDPYCTSPYSTNEVSITPKKGLLTMFQGYVDHEVLPGGEGCERTIIAFNIG